MYTKKVKDILKDATKFEKLKIQPDKALNRIISQEKKIRDILKPMRDNNSISSQDYDRLAHNQGECMDYMQSL